MAYEDPGKEIRRRVDALVLAVNSALLAHYQKNKTNAKEQITVSVATGAGGQVRTPEEQAAYLLKGTSWTCNGSHMADGAKHILVKQGGQVVWQLGNLASKQKDAWAVLVKTWNGVMNTQDLRNFKGTKNFDYPGSDPLHMELPDSRLMDNDPRVIKCLEVYAKATRLEGKAKNLPYETTKGSQSQKDWLKAYDTNLAKLGGKGK
jgi:hypothetical protein